MLNASLWTATIHSIELAVTGLFFGMLLSFWLAWGLKKGHRFIQRCILLFTVFLKGIPELLFLFMLYYGLNGLADQLYQGMGTFPVFWAGALGLGCIFAGYATEVLLAGLNAIPKGQFESGLALGFSRIQTFYHLILPQTWPGVLPSLGNLWQVLLKDTALLSILGFAEMMQWAKFQSNLSLSPFRYFTIVSLIFLGFSALSSGLIFLYNKRLQRRAYA